MNGLQSHKVKYEVWWRFGGYHKILKVWNTNKMCYDVKIIRSEFYVWHLDFLVKYDPNFDERINAFYIQGKALSNVNETNLENMQS